YTSARVALGKIYYEKGDTEKAKEVFEEVIKAVPDNLFAQRKLAEIYFNEGDLDRALIHYEKVLELNPMDEEVQSIVSALKEDKPAIDIPEEPETVPEPEEPPVEEMVFEDSDYSEETPEVEPFEPGAETETTAEMDFTVTEEEVTDESIPEEIPTFSLNTRLDDEESEEKSDAFKQYSEFSSFVGEQVFEGPEELEVSPEPEEDLFEEELSPEETPQVETPSEPETSIEALLTDADRAVKEERFINAMELYKKALQIEPDNRTARQRLEELHLLLKVSGKGQEALIEELERFKNALRSGADEFSGNP
ncbi:MAG: tetratricopeptide repeat protein, partial [Nitrospirae bacterium]